MVNTKSDSCGQYRQQIAMSMPPGGGWGFGQTGHVQSSKVPLENKRPRINY
jgi:hypothetical protein